MYPWSEAARRAAREHPYPLIFATVSGSHLYGFDSPDSDVDVRGLHALPLPELLGLGPKRETVEKMYTRDGVEMDLVTHDLEKFFRLLLKRNGLVLEQLYSPIVVATSEAHEQLKAIAKGCITRHHAHHYIGLSHSQWKMFEREATHRVKPLLYVYRALLSGLHLMRSGELEPNLVTLNREVFHLPYIDGLIEQKKTGAEKSAIDPEEDLDFHRAEVLRLRAELDQAREASGLPEEPSREAREALEALLIARRLDGWREV